MDLEQACALLSVSPDASANDVRRAYLRLVKQHPPERQPREFQRVREAYDQILDAQRSGLWEWRRAKAVDALAGRADPASQPTSPAWLDALPASLEMTPTAADSDSDALLAIDDGMHRAYDLSFEERFEELAPLLSAALERPLAERPPLDARLVIDCILGLERNSQVELAETLRELYRRDIAERGAERDLQADVGMRWHVALELSRRGMTEPERRAADRLYPQIAQHCSDERLDQIGASGRRWAPLSRGETLALARHLERHAPVLRQLYRTGGLEPRPAPSRGRERTWVWTLVGIALMAVFRLFAGQTPTSQVPVSEIERRVKAAGREAPSPDLVLSPDGQHLLRLLNDALQRRDCDSAGLAWSELRAAAVMETEPAQRRIRQLGDIASEVCDSLE